MWFSYVLSITHLRNLNFSYLLDDVMTKSMNSAKNLYIRIFEAFLRICNPPKTKYVAKGPQIK